MLLPPPRFEQLRALAWSAPLTAALGFGLSAHAHWPDASAPVVWSLMLAAALCAWSLAQLAIWRSQWGTRHQWVSVCATFILFVLPWCTMPMPFAAPAHPLAGSAAVLASLLCLLLCSATWHARRDPAPVPGGRVDWPGCRVDGPKALIRRHESVPAQGRHQGLIAPLWIGGLSVAAYHGLRATVATDALLLVVATMAWALGAWLCVGPLGRALGHCWLLLRAERDWQVTFTCADVQSFQPLRTRSRWGRLWARS